MKDICIPIPGFEENQIAEVEVTVNGKKRKFNFRVASFPWSLETKGKGLKEDLSQTELRVKALGEMIENYNNGWELIQIFTPKENAKFIQVLFRQKQRSGVTAS